MSLAVKYAMKKKMARGGEACSDCAEGTCMAHGGEVNDSEDIVDTVMRKRYSEGGRVANDTDMSADMKPNEFDDLVLRDDLEFSYTGENSGDHLGNAKLDEDDDDIVSQVMKSRKKKDHNPRPA